MPVHPPLLLFLALLLLLLLPPPSRACRTASFTECQKAPFVPGHNLVGEGFNIVKMETSGATVVDVRTFMVGSGGAGNCTLCPNGLLNNQEQKLPVSVVDWRVKVLCRRSLSSRMYESSTSVVKESAKSTSTSWKIGLGLPGVGGVSMAGSHSKSSKFAQSHSSKERYSFTSHGFKCKYYTFRLHTRPPLSKEFQESLKNLPLTHGKNRSAYDQFLAVYGTHFIRRVHLGGRVHATTAIRTCATSLQGLSTHDVSNCLTVEANAVIKGVQVSAAVKNCKNQSKKLKTGQSFSSAFSDRLTEVLGGDGEVSDILFSPGKKSGYKPWLRSLKKLPGVMSYQLSSLHMLVTNNPVLRSSLRDAIGGYIRRNAVSLACRNKCAVGRSNGNCACKCSGHSSVNSDCCPTKMGVATMTIRVIRASGLDGDVFSKTDGYVKVFYGGQRHITGVIHNNDYPRWNHVIRYGTVNLQGRRPVRFEVWDRDNGWNDDRLGSAAIIPTRGANTRRTFPLKKGSLYVSLTVACGPSLKGSFCGHYAPGGVSVSGAGHAGAWGKASDAPLLMQGPLTTHNNKFV